MVHRPFKNPTFRAVLLTLTASIFPAATGRAQEPPPLAPAQFDPSDVYFQSYLARRSGEQLQQQGDFEGALEKFEQSQKLLEGIRKYYPEWKKDMVAPRADLTNSAITEVRPKADEQRRKKQGVLAELEGGVKTPGHFDKAGSGGLPGVLDGDPLAARRLAEAQAEVQRLRGQMTNPGEASRDVSRVGDLERQRDLLAAQLRAAEANVESLRARLTTSPVENEYKALNKRIEGLEQEREAMARALAQSREAHTDALAKNAILEADLTNLRKEADDLRQKQANTDRDLKKERTIANDVVSGQRRQLEAMEKSLKEKGDELSKANDRIKGLQTELQQSKEAFADLRGERDSLLAERDQMAALLKLNEAGRINQLIEQNMGLAKELREANEKVERLNLDSNEAKDDKIDALRDLAIAKSKINELHKEKNEQARRITDLESRLKGEEGALARGEASADPAEAEMLRDLIKRQLKIQERRRQQRDILVEEAKKLGSQSVDLAKAVELFDGEEIQLSPEEQRLLADRQVDGEFISPFARNPGAVEGATRNLDKELESYDRAATKAFALDRLGPARELFQMMVETRPGDTGSLCKLGVVELKANDAAAASDSFRRAIELNGDNPYAHRMLGLSLYRMGDLAGAEQSSTRSVELSPDDATSQAFLAAVCYKLGKMSEAESHYKAAIASDPMPSEPYINLALICIRKNRIPEAKKYYDLALERGALPDMKLEKMLAAR